MSIFKIQIKAGKPAKFDPNPQTVYVNDSVYWFNGDSQAHWPAPSAADPKGFLQYQIAPNSSSNQVSFPTPKKITYVCVSPNHTGETGVIIVKSRKKKGAFGGKTKKGAFARKTKKGAFGSTTK
jgi:plastocyanin